MLKPEFPADFYPHCGNYLEAKHWAKTLESPLEIRPQDWAECDFYKAGAGVKCSTCQKFMCHIMGTNLEKKFTPILLDFIEATKKWEVYAQQEWEEQRLQQKEISNNLGVGI